MSTNISHKIALVIHDLLRADLLKSIQWHFCDETMQFDLDDPIILETGEKIDKVVCLTREAAYLAPDDDHGIPVDNAYEDFHNIELIEILKVLQTNKGIWKKRLVHETVSNLPPEGARMLVGCDE